MSKVYTRITRRDGLLDDHVHACPDGKLTQGKLLKPSQSSQNPMHAHLYEHEGKIHETGIASDEPGHTHETILGDSSGPQKMPKQESFGPRNDEAFRIGREWVVRNDSDVIIARGITKSEAEQNAKNFLARF